MAKKFGAVFFLLLSASLFAALGIEDESVVGYQSLFSSLFSRAVDEKGFFVKSDVSEITITTKTFKQSYGKESESGSSFQTLTYKEGKLVEEAAIGTDGISKGRVSYLYNERGAIKRAVSYDKNNNLTKQSEYLYDENNLKKEYTCYDAEGKIRAKHKYFYSGGNNPLMTDEKVYNFSGTNILSIKYEFDSNRRLTSTSFFDYSGDLMRKQEYLYNSSNKLVKLTAINEVNDKDGEFEYLYNVDTKIDQVLFKESFYYEGPIGVRFSYDKEGNVTEKNTFLVTEKFGEKVEQRLQQTLFTYKLLPPPKPPQPETVKAPADIKKADEIKKEAIPDEILEKSSLFYKNCSLKKQNKAGRDFYEIYTDKNALAAYIFHLKGFGYSGDIFTYIIIDKAGNLKDVSFAKATAEQDTGAKTLIKNNWPAKFTKINVKNVDIPKRDLKEKVDGITGATITGEALIINVWKAIELYTNISAPKTASTK